MFPFGVQLVGILRASTALLKDIPSFKEFKSQIEELVQKLDGHQREQFQVQMTRSFVQFHR